MFPCPFPTSPAYYAYLIGDLATARNICRYTAFAAFHVEIRRATPAIAAITKPAQASATYGPTNSLLISSTLNDE